MPTIPETSAPDLEGVAVLVDGCVVAWFADPVDAEEWASSNHFGRWLMHACAIPNRPAFTREQVAEAERRGAELFDLLVPGRMAD